MSGNTGNGLYCDNNSLGSVGTANTIIADQAAELDCFLEGKEVEFIANDFNLDSEGTCNLDQPHDKPNNPNANLEPLQINAPGNTAPMPSALAQPRSTWAIAAVGP